MRARSRYDDARRGSRSAGEGYMVPPGPFAPVEPVMAKSQKKSNKEVRKPKAEKVKTNASNPTAKGDPVKMLTVKG